ncbi:MAG: hypothetical protein LUP99_03740 [Methanomicrobiales archaeon]|nr:hypothetical protein [Methanomicrobiales archaeon]
MFSEAQFTAMKMKQGSPNVKIYVISEENQIKIEEIPSKGQTPLDQIYVIRGSPTNPVNRQVVKHFFSEISNGLRAIGRENPFEETGELLPDY